MTLGLFQHYTRLILTVDLTEYYSVLNLLKIVQKKSVFT